MLYDENQQPITNTQRPMILSESERQRVYDFIQGMVYLWCNTNGNKPFYTRDLVGGENWNWENTPLQAIYDNLYDNYVKNQPALQAQKDAYEQSAITVGKTLKHVLSLDKRNFVMLDENTKAYFWKP